MVYGHVDADLDNLSALEGVDDRPVVVGGAVDVARLFVVLRMKRVVVCTRGIAQGGK